MRSFGSRTGRREANDVNYKMALRRTDSELGRINFNSARLPVARGKSTCANQLPISRAQECQDSFWIVVGVRTQLYLWTSILRLRKLEYDRIVQTYICTLFSALIHAKGEATLLRIFLYFIHLRQPIMPFRVESSVDPKTWLFVRLP